MPGLSVYASNSLLNRAFGGAAFTRPSTVYLEAYTALPDNTGAGGTTPSGNGYSGRIAVTNNATAFPAASSGVKTNGALVLGTCSGGTWGTLNGLGVWDASSTGNMLALFAFAEPLVTVSGKRVKIRAGQLSLELSGGWDVALSNSLLDHLLGGPDYTPPGTWHAGLLTVSAELSGNGYVRTALTNNTTNFPSASGGVKSNGADVALGPASGGAWSEATRFGLYTASSGGTAQILGTLASPVTVSNGQTATLDTGAIDLAVVPSVTSLDWSTINLVIEGDSQSDPAYNSSEWGTTAWSSLLDALEPTATVWIEAITESRVAFEIASRAEDEVDSKINPAKTNVAVLFAGTNDMFDGETAAATLAAVEDWIDGRRLAGFTFIAVCNCPSRTGLNNTTRNSFNSGLSGVGADLVIDVATVIGTPGQSDGTHFTQAEHNSLRDTVHAALEAALS